MLTAVLMPPSHDADHYRKITLENFNISLGSGLAKVAGKVFRIGHLGECNELTLLGALSGVEMGLAAAGVPHRSGGVQAAMKYLEGRTEATVSHASQGDRQLTADGGREFAGDTEKIKTPDVAGVSLKVVLGNRAEDAFRLSMVGAGGERPRKVVASAAGPACTSV